MRDRRTSSRSSRRRRRTRSSGSRPRPRSSAIVERRAGRAVGVTVEGVPVELVVAPPERFGTELAARTGSPEYVASLGALPDAPDEDGVYAQLGLPWCPPELREAPLLRAPPPLVELADIRGDLHCHTTWSDGKASVEEMAVAARDLGYDYIAICDHTPNVRVVPGLDADALRAQAEEIAAVNELLSPFRVLRGTECDIRSDGTLDLPDDVLAELDWVQLSLHAGQRETCRHADEEGDGGDAASGGALPEPSEGADHQPPPAERARARAVLEVALEEGVALETNGLPDRLDLRDEEVRLAVEAGVPIVCSTDAHSVAASGTCGSRSRRRGAAGPPPADPQHAQPRRGPRPAAVRNRRTATRALSFLGERDSRPRRRRRPLRRALRLRGAARRRVPGLDCRGPRAGGSGRERLEGRSAPLGRRPRCGRRPRHRRSGAQDPARR